MNAPTTVSNGSSFANEYKLYQEMVAEQQQLETDLMAGKTAAAQQDLEKMQSLVTDMDSIGHFHISTGSIYNDTIPMQEDISQMEKDLQSGNVGAFKTALDNFGNSLTDLFQRLV